MQTLNKDYDKITLDELTPSLQKKILESAEIVQDELLRHKMDSTVHVSGAEKIIWNAKAPNESPNLTGVPTAPTPSATNISNQIATTSFVNNAMRTIKPSVSESADKLKTPINVQLMGKAKSTLVTFDGSRDLNIPVTAIEADAIRGTIAPANLAGDYYISITGNARSADSANTFKGVELSEFVLKDSPKLTGNPTAPTVAVGTSTDQIATTAFVSNTFTDRLRNINALTAETLKTPFTLSVSGKITTTPVTVNGKDNVTLDVTAIDIADKLVGLDAATVNKHTVESNVPANAKFTDTVYTHPTPVNNLTNNSYIQVKVDRDGHVIEASNPSSLNVSITGKAATADKLTTPVSIGFTGYTKGTPISFNGSTPVNINITELAASVIKEDATHKFVTDAEKTKITNTLDITELESRLSAIKSELDWKESVESVADLATAYPNPQKGWTVNVNNTNTTYRYNGSNWEAISANAIPMVSSSVDGKMSKEDKQKLDGIEVGANKYVLPSKLPATIITEDSTHRWITDGEKSNYSDKYTRAQTDSKFLTKTEFVSKATATIGIGWTIDVDETQNMVFKYNGVIKGTLQTDGTFIVPTLSEITGDTGETESITLSELRSIVDLRTTTLTSIENPPAFVGQHAVVNKKIYFGISTAKGGSTETDVNAGWTPIN